MKASGAKAFLFVDEVIVERKKGSVLPVYTGAESVETDVDVFIAPVDLLDVAYGAGTLGRHSGDEEGDSGADVR